MNVEIKERILEEREEEITINKVSYVGKTKISLFMIIDILMTNSVFELDIGQLFFELKRRVIQNYEHQYVMEKYRVRRGEFCLNEVNIHRMIDELVAYDLLMINHCEDGTMVVEVTEQGKLFYKEIIKEYGDKYMFKIQQSS